MATCPNCSRPIVWAPTNAHRSMPLDPSPVDGGNVEWNGRHAKVVRAQQGVKRMVVHYATCPAEKKKRASARIKLMLVVDE